MELGENFTADRVKRNRCADPFFFRGRVVLNDYSFKLFAPVSTRLPRAEKKQKRLRSSLF